MFFDVPDGVNDGSLLSAIFIDADWEAYNAAKSFLEMAGLPNPQEREFQRAYNVHRMYMPQGFSISFLCRRVSSLPWLLSLGKKEISPVFDGRKVIHENVLQPLLQVDLSPNCCLEIVPGCPRLPTGYDDREKMRRRLAQDKVDFFSMQPEFLGSIKNPDGDTLPVITNRRAVRMMKGYEPGTAVVQDKVFGNLRDAFSDSFQSGSADKMRKLFSECRENALLEASKPEKILFTHWKEAVKRSPTERQQEILYAAVMYERRLQAA